MIKTAGRFTETRSVKTEKAGGTLPSFGLAWCGNSGSMRSVRRMIRNRKTSFAAFAYIRVATAFRNSGGSGGDRERRGGAAERSGITASRRCDRVRWSSAAFGFARCAEAAAVVGPFAGFLITIYLTYKNVGTPCPFTLRVVGRVVSAGFYAGTMQFPGVHRYNFHAMSYSCK